MPTITKRFAALAAGAIVDNAFSGSQYEFAPFDGTIEVAAISTQDAGEITMFSGPDVLAEPGTVVPRKATLAIAYPDDYFLEDEVAQGDRLKLSIRNGAAVAADFVVSIRMTPA